MLRGQFGTQDEIGKSGESQTGPLTEGEAVSGPVLFSFPTGSDIPLHFTLPQRLRTGYHALFRPPLRNPTVPMPPLSKAPPPPAPTFDPTNPLIVQADRSVLVEVDNPRYAEARDAL